MIKTITRKLDNFPYGPNPTTCAFLSCDNNLLAIGFNDGMISVYDLVKEKFNHNIKTVSNNINYNNAKDIYSLSTFQPNCIASNSSSPVIYSGFEDGMIKIFDLRNAGNINVK